MQEPDPQVVAAARRGDPIAFAELVRRYQGDVWRLSFHLVHDSATADDVTQDAFVRAFRFLPRYRGEAKFSTWLFSITRNCALDEIRRAGRRRRISERMHPLAEVGGADHTIGVEVREALMTLPRDLREPVVLIDMFGSSYADAGSILGVPVGTVKSRVHRARRHLARALFPQTRESTNEG